MKFTDIIAARRKIGKLPTMERQHLTSEQSIRLKKGICVECGICNQSQNSYLCHECISQQSMEEIREEIAILRNSILIHHQMD